MIEITLKINPQNSKRQINGINIGSGIPVTQTISKINEFVRNIGDCSLILKEDHSYSLVIRSLNTSDEATDIIRHFQLNSSTPKLNTTVLFGMLDHGSHFMFRGELTKIDKSILTKDTTGRRSTLSSSSSSSSSSCTNCSICLENTPNCVFYPCGHICICSECKQTYERNNIFCPLCKVAFTVCFRVFIT